MISRDDISESYLVDLYGQDEDVALLSLLRFGSQSEDRYDLCHQKSPFHIISLSNVGLEK